MAVKELRNQIEDSWNKELASSLKELLLFQGNIRSADPTRKVICNSFSTWNWISFCFWL
jgi:hypothetical protein